MEVSFEFVLAVAFLGGAFLVGANQMGNRQVWRGLKERCSCRTYGTVEYLDSGFFVEEPRLRGRNERRGGMGVSVGGFSCKGLLGSMPQFGMNERYTYGNRIVLLPRGREGVQRNRRPDPLRHFSGRAARRGGGDLLQSEESVGVLLPEGGPECPLGAVDFAWDCGGAVFGVGNVEIV